MKFISRYLLLTAFILMCHWAPAFAGPQKPLQVETWRVVEIPLTSAKSYADPFNDVDVTAKFKCRATTISRPAFWDGGTNWKVRFAPTSDGLWTYTTSASDTANKGLDGCRGRILARRAASGPAIFRHGFPRVSNNHRYFVYADGTPFFYLGDTHWFAMRERFATSNLPGCPSQFKLEVDTRVEEGFTVYQSEWMSAHARNPATPDQEATYNWADGINETSLPGFHNIDRKFAYLADKGMVIANAMAWRFSIVKYDDAYLRKLARYWSARYGAYPVMWTMAQEVDSVYAKDPPNIDKKWQTMALALSQSDDYHHPLTAHMCDQSVTVASKSTWRDKPYHTWFAAQLQGGPVGTKTAADFWTSEPTKPAVAYEAGYENFWSTEASNRKQAYAAYLSGFYGFGYGVAGIWDDSYSCDPPDRGTTYDKNCHVWYDALVRPSGHQMGYMRAFFETLDWWKLVPVFDVSSVATVPEPAHVRLASDGPTTVMLLANTTTQSGVLHHLEPGATYESRWFNPRMGTWQAPIRATADTSGNLALPDKPDNQDWLIVTRQDHH